MKRTPDNPQPPQASASTNSAIRACNALPDEECQETGRMSSGAHSVEKFHDENVGQGFSDLGSGIKRQRVYIVQCNGADGPVKVGIAKDPTRRLSELRIGCPYPMTMLGTITSNDPDVDERRLHLLLSHRRIHGEWFEWCDEVRYLVWLAKGEAQETSRRILELVTTDRDRARREMRRQK